MSVSDTILKIKHILRSVKLQQIWQENVSHKLKFIPFLPDSMPKQRKVSKLIDYPHSPFSHTSRWIPSGSPGYFRLHQPCLGPHIPAWRHEPSSGRYRAAFLVWLVPNITHLGMEETCFAYITKKKKSLSLTTILINIQQFFVTF